MADELPAHVRRPHARWRLDSWSLRTKISAVLLFPVLVAIVLAGNRIHAELDRADALSVLNTQAPVLRDITQLVGSVSIKDGGNSVAVHAATADLQQQADAAMLPPDTATQLNTALGQLAGFGSNPASPDPVADTTGYHDVLFALDNVVPSVVAPAGDDGLTGEATALAALLRMRTDVAVERALLGGPAGPADLVAATRAATEEAVLAGQVQQGIPATLAAKLTGTATETRLTQLAGGQLDPAGLLPSIDAETVQLGQLANAVLADLSGNVDTRSGQAQSAALRDTALVLAALLSALAIALLVARVAVPGDDEVGQLARAFDDMHGQAVRLAGEQVELRTQVSEMFMTLSRRSQSLVESQLTVIDRLEADEQDPQRLDELFRVDHLATRLRRNGENLQVLAGGRPVRRDHGPMSAVELLRAATSEVKDYRRIALGNAPYGSVRAPAGEDVVHILAELLDNATRYSNPADRVLLTADRGADGGMLLEVVDTGLGMTIEDIETANNRLAVGDAVSPETTRRMGLFVVGRLSAQHGVTVRLRRTAVGASTPGITASVHVPGDLVVTDRPGVTGRPFQLTPTPPAVVEEAVVRSGDLPLDWPTPIFDRMASRWFDEDGSPHQEWSPAEVDETRKAAETAMAQAEPSATGLPTRVPGAQLAPGAMQSRGSAKPGNGFRDPSAVRANLSRHYRGLRAARNSEQWSAS